MLSSCQFIHISLKYLLSPMHTTRSESEKERKKLTLIIGLSKCALCFRFAIFFPFVCGVFFPFCRMIYTNILLYFPFFLLLRLQFLLLFRFDSLLSRIEHTRRERIVFYFLSIVMDLKYTRANRTKKSRERKLVVVDKLALSDSTIPNIFFISYAHSFSQITRVEYTHMHNGASIHQ